MKKAVLLIGIAFLTINALAQTEAETIEWLNSKFSQSDAKFKAESDYFTVIYYRGINFPSMDVKIYYKDLKDVGTWIYNDPAARGLSMNATNYYDLKDKLLSNVEIVKTPTLWDTETINKIIKAIKHISELKGAEMIKDDFSAQTEAQTIEWLNIKFSQCDAKFKAESDYFTLIYYRGGNIPSVDVKIYYKDVKDAGKWIYKQPTSRGLTISASNYYNMKDKLLSDIEIVKTPTFWDTEAIEKIIEAIKHISELKGAQMIKDDFSTQTEAQTIEWLNIKFSQCDAKFKAESDYFTLIYYRGGNIPSMDVKIYYKDVKDAGTWIYLQPTSRGLTITASNYYNLKGKLLSGIETIKTPTCWDIETIDKMIKAIKHISKAKGAQIIKDDLFD